MTTAPPGAAPLDLLPLDELGYVQADPRGAELLFQIITEREERASIATGTNLPFSNGEPSSLTRALGSSIANSGAIELSENLIRSA